LSSLSVPTQCHTATTPGTQLMCMATCSPYQLPRKSLTTKMIRMFGIERNADFHAGSRVR
jgi:hypothetical protein